MKEGMKEGRKEGMNEGKKEGRKKGMKEGTCLFDNRITHNSYLYSTNNSQETVAKAKQSR